MNEEVKTQPQQAPQEQPQQDYQKEENWRILRQRAAQMEREKQELERKLQEVQAQKSQSSPDDYNVGDDEIIEGKHLKKYVNTIKQELQQTREELKKENERRAAESAELKLKANFRDFDEIVSEKNLLALKERFPEDYNLLVSNNDMYAKAKTAYNMIKSYGIVSANTDQERKYEENKLKPRSAATAGPVAPPSDSPLARFGESDRRPLTEERKKQVLEQLRLSKRYR